jgi:hypothetical protein
MKDYVDELRMFRIQTLITEARPLHCCLSWTRKAALLRFTRPRLEQRRFTRPRQAYVYDEDQAFKISPPTSLIECSAYVFLVSLSLTAPIKFMAECLPSKVEGSRRYLLPIFVLVRVNRNQLFSSPLWFNNWRVSKNVR